MNFNPVKLAAAIIVSLYFLWCAYDPFTWKLIDGVDLLIHEAGHPLFGVFGQFIGVAGGSLLQVIVPFVFFGYFVYHEKYYSASFVLFWAGQSILNVFVYANDAITMGLPLLGGLTGNEGGFHDWNYLLFETGLIGSTAKVAGVIRFIGTLTIILGVIGTVRFAANEEKIFDDDF